MAAAAVSRLATHMRGESMAKHPIFDLVEPRRQRHGGKRKSAMLKTPFSFNQFGHFSVSVFVIVFAAKVPTCRMDYMRILHLAVPCLLFDMATEKHVQSRTRSHTSAEKFGCVFSWTIHYIYNNAIHSTNSRKPIMNRCYVRACWKIGESMERVAVPNGTVFLSHLVVANPTHVFVRQSGTFSSIVFTACEARLRNDASTITPIIGRSEAEP